MTVTWTEFATSLGSAVGAALLLLLVIHLLARVFARRWLTAMSLVNHVRRPFRWVVLVGTVSGVAGAVQPLAVGDGWWDGLQLGLRLVLIASGAWLLASVLLFVEDLGLSRYRVDVSDNRAARRVRTQVLLVRRSPWRSWWCWRSAWRCSACPGWRRSERACSPPPA